jgi:hypothetical protein
LNFRLRIPHGFGIENSDVWPQEPNSKFGMERLNSRISFTAGKLSYILLPYFSPTMAYLTLTGESIRVFLKQRNKAIRVVLVIELLKASPHCPDAILFFSH